MKRVAVIGVLLAAVGVAVAAPIVGNLVPPATPAPAAPAASRPMAAPARMVALQTGDTPMAQRTATLGILNKRNGLSRDIQMKPGQAVRIGDLVVRLKACETSADWENEQLTGSFVQVIVRNPTGERWRKVFSGWLFKESPSLNAVEHPVYDVWTKACAMRNADVGPDTVTIAGEPGAPGAPGRRSSAPKSAVAVPADDSENVPETASSSNSI